MPALLVAASSGPGLVSLSWLNWPLWALCTTFSIGIIPILALYALRRWSDALDEQWGGSSRAPGQKQQQQQAEVGVLWYFPEKEDKAARFRRWAEVLRFKPREARLPIPPLQPPSEFTVDIAFQAFAQEDEKHLLRAAGRQGGWGVALPGLPAWSNPGNGPPLPGFPRPAGALDQYVALADGVAASLLLGCGRARPQGGGPRGQCNDAVRERIKARILSFLIQCGPPTGLTPIAEHHLELHPPTPPSVPPTNLPQCPAHQLPPVLHCALDIHCPLPATAAPQQEPAVEAGLEAAHPEGEAPGEVPALEIPGESVAEPGEAGGERQVARLGVAAALDGEAVLRTKSGEGVSRELLWAALACLGESPAARGGQQHQQTSAAEEDLYPWEHAEELSMDGGEEGSGLPASL